MTPEPDIVDELPGVPFWDRENPHALSMLRPLAVGDRYTRLDGDTGTVIMIEPAELHDMWLEPGQYAIHVDAWTAESGEDTDQ